MAKQKRTSLVGKVGHTISDLANAASVAATGSELGVLELAAEEELHIRPHARPRKRKAAAKRPAARKSRKPAKRKRNLKRRRR